MVTSFPEGWPIPRKRPNSDDDRETPQPTPRSSIPWYRNPLMITVLVLGILIGIVFVASRVWTEVLWFDQLGASRVLWTRWGTSAALFLVAFIVQYAAVMACVYWAYSRRPKHVRGQSAANLREYQRALEPFRKVVFWGLPALLAVFTAMGVASNWKTFLMWSQRQPFGITDPQFNMDISFYVFTLPVLQVVLGFLFSTLVTCVIAVLAVNYFYGGFSFSPRFFSTKQARMQVGLLAAALSLVVALRYWLGIYSLLTGDGDLVDGAMYREIHAALPAQVILAVISVLVAVMFVIAAFFGSWKLPVAGVAVTVVSALVIGGIYPALIQQFRVTPNARQLEEPYIQRNINATLAAYGLDNVEVKNYTAKTEASPGQLREDTDSTSQIRIVDPMIVSPTFRQLQQSRPYYTFDKHLSVDRYTIEDERRDTVIAVRDIYLDGLPQQQQTWVNRATVYTHGFGVVAAYGNAVRADGTPSWWESSIPSVGEMGDYEPRVYFSKNSPEYSIVGAPEGAAPQELDYPDDNAASGQVLTTFTGNGGPSVGNPWNKLLYAIKFSSTDIFFSSQTNSESQILYDRDPIHRVSKVAPFLTLEQRAYPAVVDMDDDDSTPQRLVWIIDGYTTTNQYPYAEKMSWTEATTDSRTTATGEALNADTVNYVRNSVKAVVDAYDGSIKLYGWDASDPILSAWSAVYPDMVQPMSEISGDLMAHLRYPEDMFKLQRKLLETYHVTEAKQFYTGGDRWRLSEDPTATTTEENAAGTQKLQPPYYLTMKMPNQESAEFSLTSVYVPAGAGEARRAALAGFLAVDSETGNEPGKVREDFGKLRLMALPSSTTVPGPGQVQNNFNTDQTIAMELNLLSQQGSNVRRGNLLTLPVGGGLLYVQPVYVESTSSTSYPVLRYVLTAFGEQIGFAPTLAEALDQTFGGDSQATVAGDNDKPDMETSGTPPETLTDEERLNAAVIEARDAWAESQAALERGDWAAYGRAQAALDRALQQLVDLQGIQEPGAAGSASSGEGAPGTDTDTGGVDPTLEQEAEQATTDGS